MLNKDQYNQDEYNDYYRQEVEGSELGGNSEKEGSNKILLLLGVLALGAAGYFGYTSMNSTSTTRCTTTVADEELKVTQPPVSTQVQEEVEDTPKETTKEVVTESIEVKKEEPKKVNTVESVATTVTQTVQHNGDEQMSPEEIAKVVAAVMQQMNSDQTTQTTSSSSNDDSDLMSALSGTEIESIDTTEHINLSKAKKVKDNTIKSNQVVADTYNKINVQNISGSDELSKLSDQISDEINSNEGISSTTVTNNEEDKEYSTDIKKEVVFREKEMRIIIVKKGDTLGKLAKRAYGNVMAYKKIYQANPDVLKRPDRIYIGQRLRIPE